VRAGVGAALITRLMVDFDDPATAVYDIDGIPPRRIGLVHHADRDVTPMMARFLALAQAAGSAVTAADQSTTAIASTSIR
jgi:DNA-binding transcriptional LysR family regulator